MTLGRVVVQLDAEDKSIVPVRFLTRIIVVGDVISFLMQCGGMMQTLALLSRLYHGTGCHKAAAIWLPELCLR